MRQTSVTVGSFRRARITPWFVACSIADGRRRGRRVGSCTPIVRVTCVAAISPASSCRRRLRSCRPWAGGNRRLRQRRVTRCGRSSNRKTRCGSIGQTCASDADTRLAFRSTPLLGARRESITASSARCTVTGLGDDINSNGPGHRMHGRHEQRDRCSNEMIRRKCLLEKLLLQRCERLEAVPLVAQRPPPLLQREVARCVVSCKRVLHHLHLLLNNARGTHAPFAQVPGSRAAEFTLVVEPIAATVVSTARVAGNRAGYSTIPQPPRSTLVSRREAN